MATYVELQVTTHFSFLRGASSPEELFSAAALQGHSALGIADLGTVAGIVRAWDGQKATGVRLIAGSRILLDDGHSFLLYPTDKPAWSRLTRLLTIGKERAGKGGCDLEWADIVSHADGLIAILMPDKPGEQLTADPVQLRHVFGDRGYLSLAFRRRPGDAMRLHELDQQARAAGVRSVTTGDVLYHAPENRMLQDVVTAIREKCTIETLGFRRERHADRHLKRPEEMERRFAKFPDAIAATVEIARRCTFDLGELTYRYRIWSNVARQIDFFTYITERLRGGTAYGRQAELIGSCRARSCVAAISNKHVSPQSSPSRVGIEQPLDNVITPPTRCRKMVD